MTLIRYTIVIIGYLLLARAVTARPIEISFWPVFYTTLIMNAFSLTLLYLGPIYLATVLLLTKEDAKKSSTKKREFASPGTRGNRGNTTLHEVIYLPAKVAFCFLAFPNLSGHFAIFFAALLSTYLSVVEYAFSKDIGSRNVLPGANCSRKSALIKMSSFIHHPTIIILLGYFSIPSGWANFVLAYLICAPLVIIIKPIAQSAAKTMAMSYEVQA